MIKRWAEPELNRRPLACKANVLTRLDDRPAQFALQQPDLSFWIYELRSLILEFCLINFSLRLLFFNANWEKSFMHARKHDGKECAVEVKNS